MDEFTVFSFQSDVYIKRCTRKINKLRNLYYRRYFSGIFTSWALTISITLFILLFFSDSPLNPINASAIFLKEPKSLALFFLDPIQSFTFNTILSYLAEITLIIVYSTLISGLVFILFALPTALYLRGNIIFESVRDSLYSASNPQSLKYRFGKFFLDRSRFLTSKNQERIFPIYFVLVIIFMLLIVFRLTPFLEDRYQSLSLLTSLLGAAYIYLVVGVIFILHIVYKILVKKMIENQLKMLFFDDYIIWKLQDTIAKVSDHQKWKKLDYRLGISYSLLEVGKMFRDYAPRLQRGLDPSVAILYRENMNVIYHRFRTISSWSLTPKHDTRQVIQFKLEKIISEYIQADIDSLLSGQNERLVNVPTRKLWINQIEFWLGKILRTLAPIVLVWLFTLTPLSPSGNTKDYLTSGSFALSGLMGMAEIDPKFGDKLNLLKSLKELLKK